jgi:hypothetical protein
VTVYLEKGILQIGRPFAGQKGKRGSKVRKADKAKIWCISLEEAYVYYGKSSIAKEGRGNG